VGEVGGDGFLLRKKKETRDIRRRLLIKRNLDFPKRKGRMRMEAIIPVLDLVKMRQIRNIIERGELKDSGMRIQR
jgi:hypothetical protein